MSRPLKIRGPGSGARRLLPLLLLLLLCPGSLVAQVPPDAPWRTTDTDHFRINFVQGLDSLAARAAVRAEWAYEALSTHFVRPPAGKIDIVLTDAMDVANGSAGPLPSNRIVVYATPPVDVMELSYTDDWLELLLLHELAHIFHLDGAGGWWGAMRSLMGRNGYLFPQANSPAWLIEGVATWFESELTGAGRVHGTAFDMMLRAAVLGDSFFTLDRASGDPRRWPAGQARYAYGASFLDYLVRHRGAEGLAAFVDRYGAQTVPWLLNRGARRSLDTSFSRAWRDWADSLAGRYAGVADSLRRLGLSEPEILTSAGRDARSPRYSPDGTRIAYTAATGVDQPALRLILPGGTEREVAPVSALGPVTWSRDGSEITYAELEFRGPHRLFSDLRRARVRDVTPPSVAPEPRSSSLWSAEPSVHATPPGGGPRRRLTRDARLLHPDLHPDGRTLVAVRAGGGNTVLVTGDPDAGAMRPLTGASLDTLWAHPRWSPSGNEIAAVRWLSGGLPDIVVLDASGRVMREVTRDRAVDGAPSWSPDGRHLLFWSDRDGIPNLYAYDLADGALLRVTRVLTGAFDPEVSPDGRWLAFSYYLEDGYHIARIPYAPASWPPASEAQAEPGAPARTPPPSAPGDPVRRYSAWPTVRPHGWSPIASAGTGLGVGAGVGLRGADVIRRHQWAAELLAYAEGGRVQGGAAYRYHGFGVPIVDIGFDQRWRVACSEGSSACGGDVPLPSAILRRDREASAALLFVRQRVRSQAWLRASAGIEKRDLAWKEPDEGEASGLRLREAPPDAGVGLELGRSTVREFPLSIGPQTGLSLVASGEARRYLRPIEGESDAEGYLRAIGRGRAFTTLLGRGRQVLALRADAGGEFGPRSPGLDVGGASGGALPLAVDLELIGRGLTFPVRGYPEGAQFGNRAVAGSAEYRFPLHSVERGVGLIPVYLDRFTGGLFVDAGTAWCQGACPAGLAGGASGPDLMTSVGAELVTDLKFGFGTWVPLRVGVGVPLSGGGAQGYVRVGRSF